MRMTLGLLLSLIAFSSGCADELTEIVVVVDTDLVVPSEMDRVRVTVDASGIGGDLTRAEAPLVGGDAIHLPAIVGVVHGEGPLGPIVFTAEGLLDEQTVIDRIAETSFIEGRTLLLRLDLLSSCFGVECTQGQSCGEAGCGDIAVDPGSLPEWACGNGVESCNGLDDDCDGQIDEGDDLCSGDAPHLVGGRCEMGRCQVECATGWFDCDDQIETGCESNLRELDHCGGCYQRCDRSHGTASCESGICELIDCDTGWFDCDAVEETGCESLLHELDHCGGCGIVCDLSHAGETCSTGICDIVSCEPGWFDCDEQRITGCEVETATDIFNCGACGYRCPGLAPRSRADCEEGRCSTSCDSGWGDCDGDLVGGCETDLSSVLSCGGCGVVCSGERHLCSEVEGGLWGCISPPCPDWTTRCDDSCVDLESDPRHCGICGRSCPDVDNGAALCVDGSCSFVCDPDFGDCDDESETGCEAPLNTVEHCGTCEVTCEIGEICAEGRCVIGGCGDGRCGDGTCCDDEDSCTCPADCGENTCGNGTCCDDESSCDCPADCGVSRCGDGLCCDDESSCDCPADCEGPTPVPWYLDDDEDGYGDVSMTIEACQQPVGYVSNPDDCDDSNGDVYPSASETCNDRDDDCDGTIDEGLATLWFEDGDGDGYGDSESEIASCFTPAGFVSNDGDCDDDEDDVNPDASETCNATDDNCDGEIDEGTCDECERRELGGSIYLLCMDILDWANAGAWCRARGYDLVIIDSAAEDTWLWGEVSDLYLGDWWLGMSDVATEGTYLWVDGSVAWAGGGPVGYSNWRYDAPYNTTDRNCCELDGGYDGEWVDSFCDVEQPFVCELTVP